MPNAFCDDDGENNCLFSVVQLGMIWEELVVWGIKRNFSYGSN